MRRAAAHRSGGPEGPPRPPGRTASAGSRPSWHSLAPRQQSQHPSSSCPKDTVHFDVCRYNLREQITVLLESAGVASLGRAEPLFQTPADLRLAAFPRRTRLWKSLRPSAQNRKDKQTFSWDFCCMAMDGFPYDSDLLRWAWHVPPGHPHHLPFVSSPSTAV